MLKFYFAKIVRKYGCFKLMLNFLVMLKKGKSWYNLGVESHDSSHFPELLPIFIFKNFSMTNVIPMVSSHCGNPDPLLRKDLTVTSPIIAHKQHLHGL